jgi:hypothetical protein
MGRRKSLSPTSAVATLATTTPCLASGRARAPGTLDHLCSLGVNDVLESLELATAHGNRLLRHLLDLQITL